MFQSYYFYATGHETTFTHIKWEAGFHGFEGDNNNPLLRIILMILILINTFSSNLLTSISSFGLRNSSGLKIEVLIFSFFIFSSLKVTYIRNLKIQFV